MLTSIFPLSVFILIHFQGLVQLHRRSPMLSQNFDWCKLHYFSYIAIVSCSCFRFSKVSYVPTKIITIQNLALLDCGFTSVLGILFLIQIYKQLLHQLIRKNYSFFRKTKTAFNRTSKNVFKAHVIKYLATC